MIVKYWTIAALPTADSAQAGRSGRSQQVVAMQLNFYLYVFKDVGNCETSMDDGWIVNPLLAEFEIYVFVHLYFVNLKKGKPNQTKNSSGRGDKGI